MTSTLADDAGHFRPDVFARFVGNALTPDERKQFESHLTGCPRCRGMLAVQQRSSRGPNAITLDGVNPAVTRISGETTLPVGEPTLPPPTFDPAPRTDPPTPAPGEIDATKISVADPRQNALTHTDLPRPGAPAIDPLIGKKLGDYVVQELIARGGMAAVYKGVQPVIGKNVAIKVMLPVSAEHDFAQRMVLEAQTVNAIAHPNIIDIFGAGALPDGRPYLVMEFLAGKSIAEWVRRARDPIPGETIVNVLEQICSALEAAHGAGVVHRDIKPANIMLTQLDEPIPRVKVVDFGLAKSGDMSLRTAPDVVLGTPGFVSPEQITGQRATPLSDLYSVGLTAWFMVARTDAYPRNEHVLTTMRRQMNEEAAPLKGRPGVSNELAALIADLCRIDPAARPQGAAAVMERLRAMKPRSAVAPPPGGTVRNVPVLMKEKSNPRGQALSIDQTAPKPTVAQRKRSSVDELEALTEVPLEPALRTKPEPAFDPNSDKTPLVLDGEQLLAMAGVKKNATSASTIVFQDAPVKNAGVAWWVWVLIALLGLALAVGAAAVVSG
jgi:serine/threonine protein kinase